MSQPFHGGALGQVLANQTVGVFVGAAFPGVIGSREVEENIGDSFDLLVGVELGSVVNGDGAEQVWLLVDQLQEASVYGCSVAGREMGDQNGASEALNQVRMQSWVAEPMTV